MYAAGLTVSQGTIYVTIQISSSDVIVKALPDPTSPEQWTEQAAKVASWAKPGAGESYAGCISAGYIVT